MADRSAYSCENEECEVRCMIIQSEAPVRLYISSDCGVSSLRPPDSSRERGPSRVTVPETEVITVLGKGMKADRWRDTNRNSADPLSAKRL